MVRVTKDKRTIVRVTIPCLDNQAPPQVGVIPVVVPVLPLSNPYTRPYWFDSFQQVLIGVKRVKLSGGGTKVA